MVGKWRWKKKLWLRNGAPSAVFVGVAGSESLAAVFERAVFEVVAPTVFGRAVMGAVLRNVGKCRCGVLELHPVEFVARHTYIRKSLVERERVR